MKIFLDDIREELHTLMLARPLDERKSFNFNFAPRFAATEFAQSFGCKDYKRSIQSRTVDLTAVEHPCYAGLGSVADFHDDLLYFAYKRQIETDFPNTAYYLECLQVLAEGRKSEDLDTKVAIAASEGQISLRDVRMAYQHFGHTMHAPGLDDNTVVGIFHARLADSPKQEAELRRDLKIIGQHRMSSRIQNVASQTINNYQQALSFLDANEDTTDEFITSMFSVKVDGKPSEETAARQAVALIANHRKSRALKEWLDTGTLGEVEMDVGQAYARLDITDRQGTEDEMIVTLFNLHSEEQPSQTEDLKKALAAIAKDRNSKILMDHAGIDIDGSVHTLSEWPVALNNIGNTCYLNSLLQFYFSIRPFRDLVLHFDEFRTPTESESLKFKRVGGRNVSRKEIERAQRTAEELRTLFQNLITSATSSIRPDTEVARLTLLTPKAEIARRQSIRQSMDNAERPTLSSSLGVIDGLAIQGPAGPPVSGNDTDDAVMLDSPSLKGEINHAPVDGSSRSSTQTLVEEPTVIGDPMDLDETEKYARRKMLDEKEKLSSDQTLQSTDSSKDGKLVSLTQSSPSPPNEQTFPIVEGGVVDEPRDPFKGQPLRPPPPQGPTNHPPPIPPRPKPVADATEAVREAEFAAQQQDVNEIAYNVLNQMQCAIKPLAIDETGEQIDQVKHIFYGKLKTFITSNSGQIRSKEEYMSDIKVNVLGGSRDIYSALDGAFDVEDVAVAGGIEPKYSTISQLPPVLQIHVQRGQFDPVTKKESKSDNYLGLKDVIYMDRYMDSSDPEFLGRRKGCWQWKKQLTILENRRNQLIATDVSILTVPRPGLKLIDEHEHVRGS